MTKSLYMYQYVKYHINFRQKNSVIHYLDNDRFIYKTNTEYVFSNIKLM